MSEENYEVEMAATRSGGYVTMPGDPGVRKPASVYASKAELEALRQEVAHLKRVQQDNFNMAVRAVAEVLVAADKAGAEQDAETMGEKMLAMIRKGGAA